MFGDVEKCVRRAHVFLEIIYKSPSLVSRCHKEWGIFDPRY